MNNRKPYLVLSQGNEKCNECEKEIKKGDTVFITPQWVGEMCLDCFDGASKKYNLTYTTLRHCWVDNPLCIDCDHEITPDDTAIVFSEGLYHFECGFPELIERAESEGEKE